MSLFSAVQQSANALRVNELGLQVAGNNIANANTPGYLRQELVQAPTTGTRLGGLIVGNGVRAVGVIQQVDEFTLERLRQTASELAFNDELQRANVALETAFNELGENDISSSLSRFSASLQDLANQPGNASIRSLVLQRGVELANQIDSVRGAVEDLQLNASGDISAAASEINRLSDRIAVLNRNIVEIEGGELSNSDAVGLRDERIQLLEELSEYVTIDVREQVSGAVTVIVGGDFLVADGISRPVRSANRPSDEGGGNEVRFVDTDAPLRTSGGRLRGFQETRDGIAGDFLVRLDDFTGQLINHVNRLHSQGQGNVGFTSLVADNPVENEFAPLEQSGLPADIDNGSFVVSVFNGRTNLQTTHDITVQQTGFPDDTTAESFVQQLNDIDGISAQLNNNGRLEISSDSETIQFSFSNDTSGVLAALGINTFFSGSSASDIKVKPELLENPNLLAASLDGVGNGANNALAIAEAFDSATEDLNGLSLREIYEGITIETVQQINAQRGVTEGLENFFRTLEAEHLSVSGVSLDEEAIRVIQYQRAFQATSRLISTANDLLETLVNII